MANHDFVLENNPGRAVRTDFNAALAALASNNAGTIEPAVLYPGMLWLDLSVLPDGLMRQRNQSNSGWLTMSGVPDAATLADMTAGTNDTMYVSPDVLDQSLDLSTSLIARNLFVNPAMQISQENGDSVVNNTSGNVVYPVDQWGGYGVAGASANLQRLTGAISPQGSNQRIRNIVATAKSVLTGTDAAGFLQHIEGVRIASLMWGTAAAKPVVLRFGFRGPAGTYSASIRNGAATRSYIRSFTISAAQANADIEVFLVFPGDTLFSATNWPNDNNRGMMVTITTAAGPTIQNSAGAWIAGNYSGAAGMTNGFATVGNDFQLMDTGLYEDVSGVGTPPRWQYPNVIDAYRECQRYYSITSTMFSGWVINGNGYYTQAYQFPVDMRTTPSLSGATASISGGSFPVAPGTYTSAPGGTMVGTRYVRENRTANSGSSSGFFHTNGLVANARM